MAISQDRPVSTQAAGHSLRCPDGQGSGLWFQPCPPPAALSELCVGTHHPPVFSCDGLEPLHCEPRDRAGKSPAPTQSLQSRCLGPNNGGGTPRAGAPLSVPGTELLTRGARQQQGRGCWAESGLPSLKTGRQRWPPIFSTPLGRKIISADSSAFQLVLMPARGPATGQSSGRSGLQSHAAAGTALWPRWRAGGRSR